MLIFVNLGWGMRVAARVHRSVTYSLIGVGSGTQHSFQPKVEAP